jgi:hypothetical protein
LEKLEILGEILDKKNLLYLLTLFCILFLLSNVGFYVYASNTSLSKIEIIADDLSGIPGDSSIAVFKNETVHVIYRNDLNIYYRCKNIGSSWGSIENVTNNSKLRYSQGWYPPKITVDNTGNVHIVWVEETSPFEDRICYRMRTKEGIWKNTEVVSNESSKDSYSSTISVDKYNNIHVVWMDDSVPGFCYRMKSSDGYWSKIEIVAKNIDGGFGFPHIDTFNDTVHLVCGCRFDQEYLSNSKIGYCSKTLGGNWSELKIISTDSNGFVSDPSLAVNYEGDVHIVWLEKRIQAQSYNTYIVYKIKTNNGVWSESTYHEVAGSVQGEQITSPILDINNQGISYLVYTSSANYIENDNDVDVFYEKRSSSGDWSSPQIISTNFNIYCDTPSMVLDSNGMLHVTWYNHGLHVINYRYETDNIYSSTKESTKDENSFFWIIVIILFTIIFGWIIKKLLSKRKQKIGKPVKQGVTLHDCPSCGYQNPFEASICNGCGINLQQYGAKIQKLKQMEQDLNEIDIGLFTSEINSIRQKCKNPAFFSEIESEMVNLVVKVENEIEKQIITLKSRLEQTVEKATKSGNHDWFRSTTILQDDFLNFQNRYETENIPYKDTWSNIQSFKKKVDLADKPPGEQTKKEEKKDYYKILGIRRNATKAEIKNAFQTKIKTYHPDKILKDTQNTPDDINKIINEKAQEINEAYETLIDDKKRKLHDESLQI